MRIFIYNILLFTFILFSKRFDNVTISPKSGTLNKVSIVVLPPYDKIANKGGSPVMQRILDHLLRSDSSINLLSLTSINCAMIYNKKYCQDIIDNLHPDIILMTKLDYLSPNAETMQSGIWGIEIKAYFPKRDTTVILYHTNRIQNDGSIEKDVTTKFDSKKMKSLVK